MKCRLTTIRSLYLLLSVIGLMTIAIGFRPDFVGSDTSSYIRYYQVRIDNLYSPEGFDYLFDFIVDLFVSLGLPVGLFLSFIALINFIALGVLSTQIEQYCEHKIGAYRMFLVLSCCMLVSSFFFSTQTNVIRHGTSILALFIFNLLLLQRANIVWLIAVFLIALGFHHTALLFSLFSPLVLFSYRTVMSSVLVTSFLYMTGLSMKCIKFISSVSSVNLYEQIINYGVKSGYKTGVRLDFAIFTLVVGLLFYGLAKLTLQGTLQKRFFNLLKIYWILSLPFFIFGFGAYSDRYLLPAWVYISALSATLIGLILSKLEVSIGWYYLVFLISVFYFINRAQGYIN